MAYATPTDVQARLGRTLDTSETQVVQARLNDAELIIRSRITDLDQKIIDGVILEAAVVMVEAEMVLRLVRNPDGYTSETDGNYTYQLSTEVASGRLSVMPNEWALLGIRGGVYTITPYVQIPGSDWPPEFWSTV